MKKLHCIINIDNEIINFFKKKEVKHVIIIVLFKGKKLPKFCVPMLRKPNPKFNVPLNKNNNLSKIYFSALKKNPAIEDGAILIQVKGDIPILRGFSYRLFPPPLKVTRAKNKGSGYNTSLDFSFVKRVECVYFLHKGGVIKFVNGKEKALI